MANSTLKKYLVSRKQFVQGAPIKKQSLRKNAVFQSWQYRFEPIFKTFYVSIHTRYPANFIEITGIVPQMSSLNFKVHFFK